MKSANTLFIVFFFFIFGTIQAQETLVNGLVAYYPFNGNANDESGNGKNGTIFNTTLSDDRFGNSNSCYEFNSSNSSYISLPDIEESSISLWVYLKSPANDISIYSSPVDLVGQSIFINFEKPNDPIGCANTNLKFDKWCIYFGYWGNDICLPLKEDPIGWHNITISRSDNVVKAAYDGQFLDGYLWDEPVLDGTDTGTGSWSSQMSQPFTLPRTPNTKQAERKIGSTLDGKIDNIRLYNRALSDSEILAIYNETQSSIDNIETNLFDNLIKVYPIPTKSGKEFTIDIENYESNLKSGNLTIYSTNGQIIQKRNSLENEMKIGELSQGCYIIEINLINKRINKKIIVY
jgi:hypothetical protein